MYRSISMKSNDICKHSSLSDTLLLAPASAAALPHARSLRRSCPATQMSWLRREARLSLLLVPASRPPVQHLRADQFFQRFGFLGPCYPDHLPELYAIFSDTFPFAPEVDEADPALSPHEHQAAVLRRVTLAALVDFGPYLTYNTSSGACAVRAGEYVLAPTDDTAGRARARRDWQKTGSRTRSCVFFSNFLSRFLWCWRVSVCHRQPVFDITLASTIHGIILMTFLTSRATLYIALKILHTSASASFPSIFISFHYFN